MIGGTNLSESSAKNLDFDSLRNNYDQNIWTFNMTGQKWGIFKGGKHSSITGKQLNTYVWPNLKIGSTVVNYFDYLVLFGGDQPPSSNEFDKSNLWIFDIDL